MTDILTAISLAIALMTWLLTYLKDKKDKKREHTAQILSAFTTNENLSAANYFLTKLVNQDIIVDMEKVDEKTEMHIVSILDHYEFICEMYYRTKIIDRTTLIELRGRLMCKTFVVCEKYIYQTRDRQKRQVYDSFERFVQQYKSML